MNCASCQTNLTEKYVSSKIDWIVYVCQNCNLKQSYVDYSKKVYEKSFWDDANYKNYIGSDFSAKEVQDLVLSWSSWFNYFKNHLINKKSLLEIGFGTGVSLVMFEKKEMMFWV